MISQQNKGIIFIFASCMLVIMMLYLFADRSIIMSRGFIRSFLDMELTTSKVIPVNKDSYIAGFSSHCVFIGNTTKDSGLLKVNIQSLEAQNLYFFEATSSPDMRVLVDSTFFYIKDGRTASLGKGNLASGKVTHIFDYGIPFIDAVVIGDSSFVLRTIDIKNENAIIKLTATEPHLLTKENILEKQTEGLFSTAGALHYSKTLKQLIYLYYYRNEYILLDTMLCVHAIGRTIDTVSKAQVKTVQVKENLYTVSSPPAQVNLKSFVFDSYLLVNSNLIGDDEEEITFTVSSVIDVYDLVERKYLFSFYIPDYAEEKMKSFQISSSILVVAYDHYVLLYSFNLLHATEAKEQENILPAGRIRASLVETARNHS